MMKKYIVLLMIIGQTILGFAQDAVALIDKGNSEYQSKAYASSEEKYRLSTAKADTITAAKYDLANAIYKQNRNNEAGELFLKASAMAKTKAQKAQAFHNLGNSYFRKGKYEEAIEAYKNSLRNNSKDEETRYNLALAKELLKKNNKNKQNNKDNKDKKDDKNDKDKEKKDDKNKDKKDKDKDKKDDKNKDKKDKDKDKKDDKKDDKNKDKNDKDKDKKGDKNKDKKDKDKDKKGDKNKDKKDKDKDKKDDKNEDKKDKDKDKKDGKDGQNKDKKGDKKQNPNGQPQKVGLSPQEAKRLLQAVQQAENKTQKKVKAQQVQGIPMKTDKDW